MGDTHENETRAYEGWAIVELMGHRRLGGYVRESVQYGSAMLRLDIPRKLTEPADLLRATQFYSGSSIYCVTPCTEQVARSIADRISDTPEAVAYALPEPKRCDEYWRFGSACSPDFNAHPEQEGKTICGRHELQRDMREEAGSEDGLREGPDISSYRLEPAE